MDVPAIVRKVLEVTGLTQKKLGEKIDVSQGTISKWINEGHSPNLDQWQRLESFANRYKALRGMVAGQVSGEVRVMGYIGTGAEITPEFEQIPPDGLKQIEVPFELPADIIAFEVVGDSMLPAYREGDVVLVRESGKYRAEDFYEQDAAVRTSDGKRYIKEIHPGQRKGTVNLLSHNATLIKDQRLEWIGEIYAVVKARQVRKSKRKVA